MIKLFYTLAMATSLTVIASFATAAGDAARGESLVAVCAGCHGADGNSPTPMFPKIAGLGYKYLLKQLHNVKSGERVIAEMTGILDPYSDDDLADMAAYFASKPLQIAGATESQVQLITGEMVDSLELGEQVYRFGNHETGVPACSGCHSPKGLGNAPAGYPRLSGQYADYIEKQLKHFRAGDRRNDGEAMPMRGVAQYMSDIEITAVANYIAGLN